MSLRRVNSWYSGMAATTSSITLMVEKKNRIRGGIGRSVQVRNKCVAA
jgi:hypothetical protein